MNKEPRIFTKEEFIGYLKKNNVNNNTIQRVENLPNEIIQGGEIYGLNINTSWNGSGTTIYEFELNYYSYIKYEFLLPYKIYSDIDTSLNVIECEIEKIRDTIILN